MYLHRFLPLFTHKSVLFHKEDYCVLFWENTFLTGMYLHSCALYIVYNSTTEWPQCGAVRTLHYFCWPQCIYSAVSKYVLTLWVHVWATGYTRHKRWNWCGGWVWYCSLPDRLINPEKYEPVQKNTQLLGSLTQSVIQESWLLCIPTLLCNFTYAVKFFAFTFESSSCCNSFVICM